MALLELRPYQTEAVEKLLWSKDLPGADICVLPTGAGKSLIIAELAHRINAPILILQPTKEILEQNVEKMKMYADEKDIGIYSASMNEKTIREYTFGTIQSIYKKPELFRDFPYVFIDECHLVNPKAPGSMYTSFLRDIGKPKVIGLTATPYRLDQRYERLSNGGILTHTVTKLINRTKGRFWHRIIFNINVGELMEEGYLLPLEYMNCNIVTHDEIKPNKSKSDFNLRSFDDMMAGKVQKVLEVLFWAEELCEHVLVFCSTVAQAEYLQQLVPGSEVVTAKTSKKAREKLIQDFRFGRTHTVFNVGVLTTGFDFPELDGIVLLRPTRSIGLYYQMLGRGVRISEGKQNCKIFDVTSTVDNLGRIETIRMERQPKWELLSETGSWHNKPLYSFIIEPYGNN